MPGLITLELLAPDNTLDYVCALPVLKDVVVDREYGLVLVSPKRNLYVIRVDGKPDRERLLQDSHIRAVHGDVRISTMD